MNSVQVVAEIGQIPGRSVSRAIGLANMAADAGAWGLKAQFLDPDRLVTRTAGKYWTDTIGTATQHEAFTKAGTIPYDGWGKVKAVCDRLGVEFFASPFDLDAVQALEDMGCGFVKVASGDITYRALIEKCAASRMHIILSTGASSLDEVERALSWIEQVRPQPVTVLACTLAYPTPAGQAHVGRVETLRKATRHRLWPVTVGYSDHTSLPATALAAAACGAEVLEVHFTDGNAPDVADNAIAVDPDGLRAYVEAAELGAALRGDRWMGRAAVEEAAWEGARRSVATARPVAAGQRFGADDLTCLRPGTGVAPYRLGEVVGTVAGRDYAAGELVDPPGCHAATEVSEGYQGLSPDAAPTVAEMAGLFTGGPDSVEWLREQRQHGSKEQ